MIAQQSQSALQLKGTAKRPSSSQIDKLIAQKSPFTGTGVVTYDPRDLGQKGFSQRSNN
jgi:hypothetical protein